MNRETKTRPGILPQLFCGLLVSFTVFIHAPLELYLANRGDFMFSLGNFLPMFLIAFAVVFAAIEGVLLLVRLLPERLYVVILALVFGAALGLYVQGTYLSAANQLLEGGEPDWSSMVIPVFRDVVIWALILVAALVTAVMKKELFLKIVLFGSILILATECVVLGVTAVQSPGSSADGYALCTDEGEFEFSEDGDILVFMLDSFDVRIMDDILQNDPAAADFLDGFIYYRNNASLYCNTEPSLTHMLTGSRYYNDIPKAEWYKKSFDESTFFEDLAAGGYGTRLYGMPSAILNADMAGSVENIHVSDGMRVTSPARLFAVFARLVVYKYAPSCLQPFVYSNFNVDFQRYIEPSLPGVTVTTQDDVAMKARLEANGVRVTEQSRGFKYYAMTGAHEPFITDRYCEYVGEGNTDQYEQSIGSLYLLEQIFDGLRQTGAYDRSTIIILGDHGSSWYGQVRGTPCMLVKYAGETGPLETSAAPVCQEDLRATILYCAGLDYEGYGTPFPMWEGTHSRDRLYYAYSFAAGDYFGLMTEYRVPDDATYLMLYEPTGNTY